MREILFRGRNKHSREWEFGCYYKQTEFYGDEIEDHTIITSHEDLTYDQALLWYSVEPETVGQFTGLTDKSGKKIFEGDILKYQMNNKTVIVGKIVFLCGAFVFESEELEQRCDLAFVTFADDEIAIPQRCIEVIGNIHDNPELPEG